ncbi:MAG: hypothetical protein JW943_02845, partial [Deltaproteobacteria bacterium]|nr:hypothetical protein [Deltaproteobacteria bacterium]
NNFAELAPKFRSDLAAPIEQIHRNSITISRILRLRHRQRWAEDGMRKCEVIVAQALRPRMVTMLMLKQFMRLIILAIWRLSIMIILHFAQLTPIMAHGQRANGFKQLPGMMRVIDPMTSA